MSINILNQISRAFNAANTLPDTYLTLVPEKGLYATNKQEQQTDPHKIIDRLMLELATFAHLEQIAEEDPDKKVESKKTFKDLRTRVLTYFKGKVKKSHPKMAALFLSLFPAAKARWKLAQGIHKFEKEIKPDPDDNSKQGQKLLKKGNENAATIEDLDTLCYPRDILFLQQRLQSYLNQLCTIQLEICKRITTATDAKHEVFCIVKEPSVEEPGPEDDFFWEDDDNTTPALFFGTLPTNELEQELQKEVKKISCQLVTNRIVKSDRIAKTADALLKRLVAYKQQTPAKQAFVDECLQILELNELVSQRENLLDEWEKHAFCAGGYVYNEKARQLFQSAGYLPRKHLAFLIKIGNGLFNYLEKTTQESISSVVGHQTKTCEFFNSTLKKFEPNPQIELYKTLTRSLTTLIKRFLSDRKDEAKNYQEVAVVTTEFKPSHEEYEEYRYDDIGIQTYNDLAKADKRQSDLFSVTITQAFKKLESPSPKNTSTDRGFLPKAIEQKPTYKKVKKKRSSATSDSSSSSSPAGSARSSPELNVDAVINAVAKMTLKASSAPTSTTVIGPPIPTTRAASKPILRIPASEPTRKKPVEDPPVVTAQAKLKYAEHVLRWNQNRLRMNDPVKTEQFYIDKKYTPGQRVWVHVKHNFARIVDDFLELGASEQDAKKLKNFKSIRQIQLVGDITRIVNNRKDRQKGFFAYSQGEDTLWFHRYFSVSPKEDTIIDKEYAERAFKVLKNPPKLDLKAPKPNLIAIDKSYVEYQSNELIIIYDPKNHARIRLVPFTK